MQSFHRIYKTPHTSVSTCLFIIHLNYHKIVSEKNASDHPHNKLYMTLNTPTIAYQADKGHTFN